MRVRESEILKVRVIDREQKGGRKIPKKKFEGQHKTTKIIDFIWIQF